jgi:transcriptional regulator with XRE-family HTH domain
MPAMTPEELDVLVAANIRAARARLDIRQEDVADEMGWSRTTMSTVEAGTRRLSLADAVGLCRVLQIGLRELLQGAPDDVISSLRL